jgi:methanogenic corrinoid protein MtbC1
MAAAVADCPFRRHAAAIAFSCTIVPMIRWCAYCQRYIDEAPPWRDYRLSHVLCDDCARRADGSLEVPGGTLAVADLYDRLRAAAQSKDVLRVEGVMEECAGLGIRPLDMMMGVIQPILYEIGDLWAQARTTVAAEHQFTGFAASLLSMTFARYPELSAYRQSDRPRVLITGADGNCHVLGAQIVELFLASARVPTFTLLPGLPAGEVLAVVDRLKPTFLGVSVSLADQLPSVRQLADRLRARGERPTLILGGSLVREGLDLQDEPDVHVCSNLADLEALGVLPA